MQHELYHQIQQLFFQLNFDNQLIEKTKQLEKHNEFVVQYNFKFNKICIAQEIFFTNILQFDLRIQFPVSTIPIGVVAT